MARRIQIVLGLFRIRPDIWRYEKGQCEGPRLTVSDYEFSDSGIKIGNETHFILSNSEKTLAKCPAMVAG